MANTGKMIRISAFEALDRHYDAFRACLQDLEQEESDPDGIPILGEFYELHEVEDTYVLRKVGNEPPLRWYQGCWQYLEEDEGRV